MITKMQKIGIVLAYFLVPIVTSIVYLVADPRGFIDISLVPFSININPTLMGDGLIHALASILGIFSYMWMCFGILLIKRKKLYQFNEDVPVKGKTGIDWLISFHIGMSVIALIFGGVHAYFLYVDGGMDQNYTGLVGLLIFLVLMVVATLFMTNMLTRSGLVQKMRLSATKAKIRYTVHRGLHNVTMLAVLVIFIHTLFSATAGAGATSAKEIDVADKNLGAEFMYGIYIVSFIVTLAGWIGHKLVRKMRVEPEKEILEGLKKGSDKEWALKLLKANPSVYACFQCGTCTLDCCVTKASEQRHNPRRLIQAAILGLKDSLKEDNISAWLCSTCQSCVELCPQGVQLFEVFTWIRNSMYELGNVPESFVLQAKMVYDNTIAIPFSRPILKRREQMGLPEPKLADPSELQKLMKVADLDMSEKEQGGATGQ